MAARTAGSDQVSITCGTGAASDGSADASNGYPTEHRPALQREPRQDQLVVLPATGSNYQRREYVELQSMDRTFDLRGLTPTLAERTRASTT